MKEKQFGVLQSCNDMRAIALMEKIKSSTDPLIKYKDGRAIADLKHMIETSCWLYGDRPAFHVKCTRGGDYIPITYREALSDINALGTALIDMGFKGEKIAIAGENSYFWSVSYLAVVCGTGVAVPLDKELNESELKQLVVEAAVSCVISDEKHTESFKKMQASGETAIKAIVTTGSHDAEGTLDIRVLIEKGHKLIDGGDRRFLDAEIDRDAMAVILFTSGTTGIAKGVMLSHRNLAEDIMMACSALHIVPEDVFFSFLPIHHTYECTAGFLVPLYRGASIAYCEGLKYIVKNLGEIHPTVFLGVPAIFENMYKKIWAGIRKQGKENTVNKVIKINRVTKKYGLDLGNIFFKSIRQTFGGNLRLLICGGAAINPAILDGFGDFGILALQGYGLTEAAPMAALNPDTAPNSASIGRTFPGMDITISEPNEEGIGEICIEGGNIMLGYYGRQDLTDEVIKNGVFYTGDLGYIDDKGYVFITGRKKNVIITKNGKNVYPEELEYYLSRIPFIEETMVWAADNETGDDLTIIATIVLNEEHLEDFISKNADDEKVLALVWKHIDNINEELPMFKRIKKVFLRKEPLIKNTSRKIKRYAKENYI